MEKDEFFIKRIRELANLSYQRDIVTFSDFLNLNEQNIINDRKNQMPGVVMECFGGYEQAERQMVAFHRDFLGAVLNLGIERAVIGDILVQKHTAWIFCHEKIADYIIENLTRVRHTTMKLSMVDNPEHIPEPEFQEINGTCASVRLDALIGLAFQTSRNSMVPFIEGGQVFVNGKLITSNGYEPKDGDIISVRGKGRFRYEGVSRQTKKGRNSVNRNFCIVTDTNVAPLYAAEVQKVLSPVASKISVFTFEAGEKSKNLNTVQQLYKVLIEEKLDRKSLIIALGGGVVGDLAGFGAATYLRGIDFIQVPTTLLSQVDSSVGGKTGVDLEQYKNMVGAFHQPRLVYMNLHTLRSLPAEQFACGMGEVLKTGLICDGDFYQFVCAEQEKIQQLDTALLKKMIRRCCEIKAGVVERDPKEQGERALLNLGHTIGHAVEKLMDFKLLHGQCVAIGLIAAAKISLNRGLLTEKEYQQIIQGCESYRLPTYIEGLHAGDILAATKKDKKMEQGQIKFVLMKGLGGSFIDRTVTDQELLEGIQEILR